MLRDFITQRLKRGLVRRLNNMKIAGVARQVARSEPAATGSPVVFFKASTGIDDLSWNSGFHLLASWALRLVGVPVAYFACHAGMSHCVLGTNREFVRKPPPCKTCISQAKTLYTGSDNLGLTSTGAEHAASTNPGGVYWFRLKRDARLFESLKDLSVSEMAHFERESIPLGRLCLPGLRWILRIHHLQDDEDTRYLFREYILSAWNIAQKFRAFLDRIGPRAVIVFNGQFYPEAVARHVALSRGIRVITHEVGLQPATAFFTDGQATAYPIHIPEDFELNAEQNARLDAYLERRFQGDFSMAGIKFWSQMSGLDGEFLCKAAAFRQIVPVFTNVIFDTSQPHANTVFEDMFAWLDLILEGIRRHPDTLFVIRAHPDELRLRKASRETVAAWVASRAADREPNVVFIGPNKMLSSYELIQRSKFVLVYNSTIGLEASIMGAVVLCGGKARFTQYPTVYFPPSPEEMSRMMEAFLVQERLEAPVEFRRHARRFLYYQLFRTSLPFGDFLAPSVRTTQTRLKTFTLQALVQSKAIGTILDGVLEQGEFLLKEET